MSLKGVTNVGNPELSEVIRDNLITFFDWGLTTKGGYFNASIPSSGLYGGDWHKLKYVVDPNYTNGTVWEASRNNWVWENGLEVGNPVQISGIFVNNSFLPLNSGYYIDYPNGRVVFNTVKNVNTQVHLAYSYKWVKVTNTSNVPIFKRVNQNSFRVDNFTPGSGLNMELSRSKIQLPCVAIEVLTDRTYEGMELGNSRFARTDVVFHILAENDIVAGKLADIISKQDEKTINLFDSKKVAQANAFPLDYRGSVNSGITYPNLVKPSGDGGFRYTEARNGALFMYNSRASVGNWINDNIYNTTVKMTTEVIIQ